VTVNRMTSSTTKQHECTRIQKIDRSSIDVQHHPCWASIRASRVVSSIKRLGATEQSRATRGQQKLQLSGLWLGIWASLARSDANAKKTNRINGDQQRGVGNQPSTGHETGSLPPIDRPNDLSRAPRAAPGNIRPSGRTPRGLDGWHGAVRACHRIHQLQRDQEAVR